MSSYLRTIILLSGLCILLASAAPQAMAVDAVATCVTSPCIANEGESISFSSAGSTGTAPLDYRWDFGDLTSVSISQNPTHQYTRPHPPAEAGWLVTLTVIDADDNQDTAELVVPILNVQPTAVVEGVDLDDQRLDTEITVFVDDLVQFYGEGSSDASGNIVSYAWMWDYDGNPGNFHADVPNITNPLHNFDEPGEYLVGLKVTDDDNWIDSTDIDTITVNVIPLGPVARITTPTLPWNEGEAALFIDNSLESDSDIYMWEWDFDMDGSFIADVTQNKDTDTGLPEHPTQIYTYEDTGPFTLALRVTDRVGRKNIGTVIVRPENILPVANLVVKTQFDQVLNTTPEGVYEALEGVSLKFDASASSTSPGQVVGYQWDWAYQGIPQFPDWDINSQNQAVVLHAWDEDSVFANPPGDYTVRLRVTDDDSTPAEPSEDFLTIQVRVFDVPPTIAISGPASMDEGQEGEYTVALVPDADNHTSTDAIVDVEWDLTYDTVEFDPFNEYSAYDGRISPRISFDSTGTYLIAAKIYDDDYDPSHPELGGTALTTFEVTVTDLPPQAQIDPWTSGEVIECTPYTFTSRYTGRGPLDKILAFYWNDAYDGGTFTAPSTTYNNAQPQCDFAEGKCVNTPWGGRSIPCVSHDDCPRGMGDVTLEFNNGPSDHTIAVCIEDEDNPNACATAEESNAFLGTYAVHVVNKAPVFNTAISPNETVNQGSVYFFTPTVDEPCDYDRDPANQGGLQYTALEKPAGMTINPNNGQCEWEPGQEDLFCIANEYHHVKMMVTDPDQRAASQEGDILEWDIAVVNLNDPPTISEFLNDGDTATAGQPYTGFVIADDPDQICGNENIFYLLCDDDPGMTLDANGNFSWTPNDDDLGVHTFRVCVFDSTMADLGFNNCQPETPIDCVTQVVEVLESEELAAVSAGPDQELLPGHICQFGQVIDNPGNQNLVYEWNIRGPVDVFIETQSTYPDPPSICFTTSAHGDFTVSVRAQNSYAWSQWDEAIISLADIEPTAQIVGYRHYQPGWQVKLDGSRSGDYNINDGIFYEWTDNYSLLQNTNISTPQFVPLTFGVFTFDLAVNGGVSTPQSETASITFEVLDVVNGLVAPYAHIAPVPQSEIGIQVLFDASASADRSGSGEQLAYVWDYVDGPVPSTAFDWGWVQGESQILRATPVSPGTYTFGLHTQIGDSNFSRKVTRSVLVADINNAPPVANAGDNIETSIQEVAGSVPLTQYVKITLDGSASRDPEQKPLTYFWEQVEGPRVPLDTSDPARPFFYAFQPGLLAFELRVEDDTVVSLPDKVYVIVSAPNNTPPYGVLPLDVFDPRTSTVTVNPNDPVLLDASGSGDLDHSVPANQIDPDLDFEWVQTGGPAVSLTEGTHWDNAIIAFDPDLIGMTYSFRLVVWDETDTPSMPLNVKVEVLSEFNSPPECRAASYLISSIQGDDVLLDGRPSSDPDEGDTIECEWVQDIDASVAEVSVINNGDNTATVTPLDMGEYTFLLTCTDGKASCVPPTTVNVNVLENSKPTADAGDDIEATVGEEVELDGSRSFDLDNHELSYEWVVIQAGNTLGIDNSSLKPSNQGAVPKVTFNAFDSGEVTIQLIVNDGHPNGKSEPDTVNVVVKPDTNEDGDVTDGDVTDGDLTDGDYLDGDTTDGDGGDDEGGGGCAGASGSALLFASLMGLAAWRRRRQI